MVLSIVQLRKDFTTRKGGATATRQAQNRPAAEVLRLMAAIAIFLTAVWHGQQIMLAKLEAISLASWTSYRTYSI